MDEIDGQKQGSAFYAVKNHTKKKSTGRKFININDTQLVFVPTCMKAQEGKRRLIRAGSHARG